MYKLFESGHLYFNVHVFKCKTLPIIGFQKKRATLSLIRKVFQHFVSGRVYSSYEAHQLDTCKKKKKNEKRPPPILLCSQEYLLFYVSFLTISVSSAIL